MVKYVNKISKEFIVDVEGIVSVPEKRIESASHKVEIQARKVFCISKAAAQLPLNLEDTARSERELGKIVKENLSTLYNMPCWDDHHYSNSFDVFIRGEEIISGGQRIHDAELLTKQVIECGIDVNTLPSYIDSSGGGAVPHGGVGVGLRTGACGDALLCSQQHSSLDTRNNVVHKAFAGRKNNVV